MLLLDVASTFGLTGRQAETTLRTCNITLNRNALPFDGNGPWYTSGLRLGTPAVTTLGMGQPDMVEIAALIKRTLANARPTTTKKGDPSRTYTTLDNTLSEEVRNRVQALLHRYPVYPELDVEMLLTSIQNEKP